MEKFIRLFLKVIGILILVGFLFVFALKGGIEKTRKAIGSGTDYIAEKFSGDDNNVEAGTETTKTRPRDSDNDAENASAPQPEAQSENTENICYQDRGQPVEIPWDDFETFITDTGAYGYVIPKDWIEKWTGTFNNLWFEGEWDTVDQHEVLMLDGSKDAQCIECALWIIPISASDEPCSGEEFTQDDISSLFMGKKIYFTPEEVAMTKTYIIHLEDGDEVEIPYDNLDELPLSSDESQAYFRAAIRLTCAVETPQAQFQFAERLPGAYNMAIGAEDGCYWVAGVKGSWSLYDNEYHENFEVTNDEYSKLEIYFIPETWSMEEMLEWASDYFETTPSEYLP